MARTSPFDGFIATIAPPSASQWPSWCARLMPYWSARSAARWSEMSIVSRIGSPAVGARVTTGLPTLPPSESTRWSFSPERPRRYLSYALLHSGLADPVARAGNVRLLRPGGLAGLVMLLVEDELPRRNLPDVAEDVREQRLGVVLAQVGRGDLDTWELTVALGEVGDLVGMDRDLHRHRSQRVLHPLLEACEQFGERHVEDHRKPLHLRVATLLRQVDRDDVDRGRGCVRDERAAFPVEDRAALRLDRECAQLVVPRSGLVLRAREDLQRPQPEQQHGEDGQRDRGEDRHPQRHAGREQVGLFDPWIGREETVGPVAGRASQPRAPPVHAGPEAATGPAPARRPAT